MKKQFAALLIAIAAVKAQSAVAHAQAFSEPSWNHQLAQVGLSLKAMKAGEPAPNVPVPADPIPVNPAPSGDLAFLSATSEPGLSLLRQMKAMDDLAVQHCSGNPCRGLWGIQESYFASFSSMFKSTVPAQFAADAMLGTMANQLAKHTCAAKQTANEEAEEALYRLLYTENEALNYLKEIQVNAGRAAADVVFCQREAPAAQAMRSMKGVK